MTILILCTSNSCRSQMAHGFLQSFDPELEVFSAGTKPAEKVNPLAVKAMQENGIDISGHTPQNVEEYLKESWDYVITVCGGAVLRLSAKSNIAFISVLTTLPMQSAQTSLLWLNFAECAMK